MSNAYIVTRTSWLKKRPRRIHTQRQAKRTQSKRNPKIVEQWHRELDEYIKDPDPDKFFKIHHGYSFFGDATDLRNQAMARYFT